jgi:hypothetical protein
VSTRFFHVCRRQGAGRRGERLALEEPPECLPDERAREPQHEQRDDDGHDDRGGRAQDG